MPLTLYADLPARRALQVLGDVGLLLWVWLWVVLAGKVRDATLELRGPGARVDSSATDLARRLRDAGEKVSSVPLVGDGVRKPFDGAGSAARELAGAGRAQVAATESLAHWLFWVVLLLPVLVVAWSYLPGRVAFVRRATAGRRFLDSGADLDLFALRAMAHQPLHVLARVDDDPAGAWRRGDPAVVDALARLELRSVGLRPPAGVEPRGRVTP